MIWQHLPIKRNLNIKGVEGQSTWFVNILWRHFLFNKYGKESVKTEILLKTYFSILPPVLRGVINNSVIDILKSPRVICL